MNQYEIFLLLLANLTRLCIGTFNSNESKTIKLMESIEDMEKTVAEFIG